MQLTKLDDDTREPEATYRFRAGPQEVKLFIEWPLPGAADWMGVPSDDGAVAGQPPSSCFRVALARA